MLKKASTVRLNAEQNFPANSKPLSFFLINEKEDPYFLSPELKKFRSLLP